MKNYAYNDFGNLIAMETSNSGSQLMETKFSLHAVNSETDAVAQTSNSGSQLMRNAIPTAETIDYAYNSRSEVTVANFNLSGNSATLENSFNYATFLSPEIIENPFQFSSEYHDDELSLIYYNYRHYNPQTARWISRDPIEEQGGTNLYNFLENDGINNFDIYGLRALNNNEQSIVDCLTKTANSSENKWAKNSLNKLIERLKNQINNIPNGKSNPCQLDITINSLGQFCNPSKWTSDKYDCSPFVRDILKKSGVPEKCEANAGAFLNGNDRHFKRDYGYDAPSISFNQAKMGDIVAGGNPNTQATNSSHVGIYLGGGLYVSQSKDKIKKNELTSSGTTNSQIRIRHISNLFYTKAGNKKHYNVRTTARARK